VTEAIANVVQQPDSSPQAIFNCPECSHYLAPGSLACPECNAIVYGGYLRTLAIQATEQEDAGEWLAARETWRQGLDWVPEDTKQATAVHQRIALIDTRLRGAEENKEKWTRRLGPFAPVVFFLAKAKTFLFFLFKAKFLLSFVGFFGLYWALFGWRFGLGFTLSILVHEMGHFVAAKRRGLKVDLPVFIPGMGAYVRWYSMGVSLDDLSTIALAGPFFGLIFAIVCGGLAAATHNPLFSALAHVSAWLNLLNLIPIFGLDGAQATYALDRTQRWRCGEATHAGAGAVCAAAFRARRGDVHVPGYATLRKLLDALQEPTPDDSVIAAEDPPDGLWVSPVLFNQDAR
jgi:Zn-dependent protease